VVFILLHETSHAVFDLLKVPILGREEDAADSLAAFLLLRAGEGLARRVLGGAAWMYLHDSKGRMPDDSDFSDVHGLDSQRFYNVLCMAHGSDPASFKGIVEKGYLPKERAEGCADEFPPGLLCREEAHRPEHGRPGLGADQGGATRRVGRYRRRRPRQKRNRGEADGPRKTRHRRGNRRRDCASARERPRLDLLGASRHRDRRHRQAVNPRTVRRSIGYGSVARAAIAGRLCESLEAGDQGTRPGCIDFRRLGSAGGRSFL